MLGRSEKRQWHKRGELSSLQSCETVSLRVDVEARMNMIVMVKWILPPLRIREEATANMNFYLGINVIAFLCESPFKAQG
jgi:hypothetical protein